MIWDVIFPSNDCSLSSGFPKNQSKDQTFTNKRTQTHTVFAKPNKTYIYHGLPIIKIIHKLSSISTVYTHFHTICFTNFVCQSPFQYNPPPFFVANDSPSCNGETGDEFPNSRSLNKCKDHPKHLGAFTGPPQQKGKGNSLSSTQ